METRTMRALDWYVGVPLCYLLAIYSKLRNIFPRKKRVARNVLFIKFFGLGSIILTSPAIKAAREHFPGATIHYLTFASNKQILEVVGNVDQVHTIDTGTIFSFILSTVKAVRTLRRADIDLALDLEFFAKFPLVVSMLIGARQKAGFYLTYEPWRKSMLDYLGTYNHYWHVKDIFLSLVYLSKTADTYYLRFNEWSSLYTLSLATAPESSISSIEKLLKVNGWKRGNQLIILNPNAGKELAPVLKRWKEERWAKLTEELIAKYRDALIVYTGSESELPYVEDILSRVQHKTQGRIFNSAGKLSLKELLALFSLSTVLITIDSGPMHLAALTKIPIVSLFFAETPTLYAPLSSSKIHTISPNVYSVPSFTVYMGKDPVYTPTDTIAGLVDVDDVLNSLSQVMSA